MTLPAEQELAHLLVGAARAMARAGLVDAYGHVSIRVGPDRLLITPPIPLAWVDDETTLLGIDLDAAALPDGAPREAWLHRALARGQPAVGGICRAQPRAVAALAALDRTPLALNGNAAMVGPIALYPDSRLVRSAEQADEVLASAIAAGSDGPGAAAIVLRGNGAVTTGATVGEAVARMWVLERAAELSLAALAAGNPRELPAPEIAWWRERADELLPRVYRYLGGKGPDGRDAP